MLTQRILERMYPRLAVAEGNAREARTRWALFLDWFLARGWYLVSASLALVVWSGFHVYYYNELVNLQTNATTAQAQIEAQGQRRHNIQVNLAWSMSEYSRYEREVLTRLTELRTRPGEGQGTGGAPVDAGLTGENPLAGLRELLASGKPLSAQELLRQIQVVAEQYPQLKLTENFQQATQAMVDNEVAVTTAILAYNEAVNDYTTYLAQFPVNLFGRLAGFKTMDFYRPEPHALVFKPVADESGARRATAGPEGSKRP